MVCIAPSDELLDKVKSNLQEVAARGGKLIVFTDYGAEFVGEEGLTTVSLPEVPSILSPMVHVVPLQLLAYHVAVMRGTDVDQPRNLAKSVTVE